MQAIARTSGARIKMSTSDAAVVVAGTAAATFQWWEPILAGVPSIVQGVVAACTVIFVVARAVNEVLKFIRSEQERRRERESEDDGRS